MFLFDYWLSDLNYKNRNAEIPEEVNDIYDESEYKNWLNYTMEKHRFSKIVGIINTSVFVLLLLFKAFPFFAEVSSEITSIYDTQIILFMGMYSLITFIIGIPISYYNTFSIEERYGFNKTTRKTFIIDKIKSLVLTIGLGGALIFLLTTLYTHAGNMFYVYTWASIVGIMLIVQMLYVRVIVPLFNKLTPLEEGSLKDKIHAFAEKVGFEVTKISVIDASKRSTKLNAYFVGFGRFKQIVLYDTLIEKMTDEEVVAVLAHEVGHNKHKHIIFNLFQMAFTLSIYIGVLIFVLKVSEFSTAFGFENSQLINGDGHLGFALILFSVLLSPIATLLSVLTAYISRKFEFQADAYAAINHGKDDMITALKVLSKENFSNLTPHPLYVKLLYSHPPVAQRIRAIRKVD
jgi:STE24 endopeptidase